MRGPGGSRDNTNQTIHFGDSSNDDGCYIHIRVPGQDQRWIFSREIELRPVRAG